MPSRATSTVPPKRFTRACARRYASTFCVTSAVAREHRLWRRGRRGGLTQGERRRRETQRDKESEDTSRHGHGGVIRRPASTGSADSTRAPSITKAIHKRSATSRCTICIQTGASSKRLTHAANQLKAGQHQRRAAESAGRWHRRSRRAEAQRTSAGTPAETAMTGCSARSRSRTCDVGRQRRGEALGVRGGRVERVAERGDGAADAREQQPDGQRRPRQGDDRPAARSDGDRRQTATRRSGSGRRRAGTC